MLSLAAWEALVADNPVLEELEPGTEALLVNRVDSMREHYRVPLDRCYELVGLMRQHWRGLSGGPEAWNVIHDFFAKLKEQSSAPHA